MLEPERVPELVRDHDRQRAWIGDVAVDVDDAVLVVVLTVKRVGGWLDAQLDDIAAVDGRDLPQRQRFIHRRVGRHRDRTRIEDAIDRGIRRGAADREQEDPDHPMRQGIERSITGTARASGRLSSEFVADVRVHAPTME